MIKKISTTNIVAVIVALLVGFGYGVYMTRDVFTDKKDFLRWDEDYQETCLRFWYTIDERSAYGYPIICFQEE